MDSVNLYNKIQEETGCDDTATAILVLAEILHRDIPDVDDLAHSICMGIRMGLFGASASDHESITTAIGELAEAVRELK